MKCIMSYQRNNNTVAVPYNMYTYIFAIMYRRGSDYNTHICLLFA